MLSSEPVFHEKVAELRDERVAAPGVVALLVARDQKARATPVYDATEARRFVTPHHDAAVSDAGQREVVVL